MQKLSRLNIRINKIINKPETNILKPIKKNGSEYINPIFCKEKILANNANRKNTNKIFVFFKLYISIS